MGFQVVHEVSDRPPMATTSQNKVRAAVFTWVPQNETNRTRAVGFMR
jgi:hypothetical protein